MNMVMPLTWERKGTNFNSGDYTQRVHDYNENHRTDLVPQNPE